MLRPPAAAAGSEAARLDIKAMRIGHRNGCDSCLSAALSRCGPGGGAVNAPRLPNRIYFSRADAIGYTFAMARATLLAALPAGGRSMRDGDAIRLTIREPSGAEQELRLDREVIRIGRARDCDVPLESGYVSRYHARLERTGHDWALVDEGSKNGVILNGRRITGTHALYSGDTIRMGDFTLIFNLADTQDEDRTIIYPFAAAELEAELLARRGET